MLREARGRLLLALLGVALACVAAPGTARAAEAQTWHAESLTSSPRGLHVTQYWSKGNKLLRAETVIAGHRLVTIVNGDLYYAVDATTGVAMAIKRNDRAKKADKGRTRLMGLEGFVIEERGGEKVGEEAMGGRMCDVWRLTDGSGKREVWLEQRRPEERLPLRVEVYDRQSGALIRTDFVQWASGLELPDRIFKPDPRFKLLELSYEEYVARSGKGETLVPVLHANLLHGDR